MAEIMNEEQFRQAKRHIQNLCANWDKGKCLLLGRICPQIMSYTLLCKYFREAVLPDWECRQLYASLFKDYNVRRCAVCGKSLQGKSSRTKYCPKCALLVHRQQKAKSIRKKRANVDN